MSGKSIELPDDAPQPGFYYHYKSFSNPARVPQSVDYYVYELVAISFQTETGEWEVVYRSLYGLIERGGSGAYFSRPLRMWAEQVHLHGLEWVPRFSRITDLSVVRELVEIRNRMYPDSVDDAYPELAAQEAEDFRRALHG